LGDLIAPVSDEALSSVSHTALALAATLGTAPEAARETLDAAKKERASGRLDAARAAFERAYFIDSAAAAAGHGDGQIAAVSLAALESLRDERRQAWVKLMPSLGRKLNLVLRDQSLADALAAITSASGTTIQVVPGSLDDVAAIVSPDSARVDFLDLRGATTAQALDWLLLPARLTWQLAAGDTPAPTAAGGLVVASQRRLDGESAWVYDVSVIAIPDGENPNDQQQAIELAKKEAEQFLSVVRERLKPGERQTIQWYAPGQLLVVGDRSMHSAAGRLLAELADSSMNWAGAAGELQRRTSKRAADRKAAVEKRDENTRRAATAIRHEVFGWQLLAEAMVGQLDLEALTQLQIAWKNPATAAMLAGDQAAIPLRSLWVLSETERALLSDSPELAELIRSARTQSAPAIAEALATLEQRPDDAAAFARVTFAALANRRDSAIVSKARPLLEKQREAGTPLAAVAALAKALLAPQSEIDRSSLVALVENGIAGDDAMVLTALACHRAGEDTWSVFRSESAQLLGRQPLSGHVVVLVNRLGRPQGR
jgi:hypothetical protein